MEPPGLGPDETGFGPFQFGQDIHNLITLPTETSTSFTALLQLPPNHAVQLLHSPIPSSSLIRPDHFNPNFTFPTANSHLIDPPVKTEPHEPDSCLNSSPPFSDPAVEKRVQNQESMKRKEPESNKAKGTSKKNKTVSKACSEERRELPYMHVRARRGQATDSHSLAERARREKINAKIKFLQELVPGCNKISGTALILDEIINHVQSLQRQVELLSMKLAAANPAVDLNPDNILSAESRSLVDANFPGMIIPVTWPDVLVNGNTLQYQPPLFLNAGHLVFTPETSLLSYDSSANSGILQLNCKQSL